MKATQFNDKAAAATEQSRGRQSGIITDTQVMRLPEPMQRYLHYAGVVGKEPVRAVRLKQRGSIRQKPEQKWMPFEAEQVFAVTPPSFTWRARMRLAPFAWIDATDKLAGGHGTMSIKLMSAIPLGKTRGPEMDQGSLVRYLGEIVWFPTAWLFEFIEWEAIDASSVKATMHDAGTSASLVLAVNMQGQPTHLRADRYMEDHGRFRLTPWSVQSSEFREADGLYIPTHFDVTWHLPGGDFTWLRGDISEIEYDRSDRVTRF